jgi:hypothetical protein
MGMPAMTSRFFATLLASVLLFGVIRDSDAHHSIAGQFDMQKSVTLKGVVSKVDWVNPHIYVHLDAKGADGTAQQWRLECVPVGMARKAGLTKAMLEGTGEPITMVVHPARDGTKHLGYIIKLTFPDGRFIQFAAEKERT